MNHEKKKKNNIKMNANAIARQQKWLVWGYLYDYMCFELNGNDIPFLTINEKL